MVNTAAIANPVSHSQTCDTFRAAARTARGTGHGTSTLVGLDVSRPVPHGFVAEHRPKAGPRRVQDGLCHPGLRHRLGVHVAYNDQLIGLHKFRGLLMQVVSSGVDNLRVDCLRTTLVASALRHSQCSLVFPVVSKVGDLRSIGHRRQSIQPEVDADFARSAGIVGCNLDLEVEIPAPLCVLGEAAASNIATNWPAIPEAIPSLEVDHRIAVQLDGAGGSERNPAEGLLATPPRASAVQIAATNELLADRLHGVAVQAKH